MHPVRLDQDKREAAARIAIGFAGIPKRAIAYCMRGFFQQVVEQYLQHSGKTANDLKASLTHSRNDHQIRN